MLWPADRIFAYSLLGVLGGGCLGAIYGFLMLLIQQLTLPSGPNVGFSIFGLIAGGIAGLLVGAAATAGAVIAILVTRNRALSSRTRSLVTGASAGLLAFIVLALMFIRDDYTGAIPTIVGSCLVAAVLAALATFTSERRRRRPFHAPAVWN